ncbi:IS3 family transposase [Burkholderia sp. 22PA0099]|uniref:IS3 family transposase n=1 Tax=Burkholderia sp. 22PA0099 TaxID=3237372 RepID=UPI0039C0EC59
MGGGKDAIRISTSAQLRNWSQERYFGSLNNEQIRATRCRTHPSAKADLFKYIEAFYNRNRRHSSLGLVYP